MTSGLKILIGVGIVGVVGLVANKLMNLAKKFDFEIAGYGMPRLSNWVLTLPINITFKNPTSLSVSAENVHADIYLWQVSQFKWIGEVNQPFTIGAGTSTTTITPAINLKQLASGNIFSTLQSIFSTKIIKVRTDVTVRYSGINLPTQSFVNDVDISSYI